MALSRFAEYEHRMNRILQFQIRRLRDRSNPMEELSEHQFRIRFRLTKEATIFVLGLIEANVNSALKRGSQIPPILQLLVTLRFYATGSFQIVVGDLSNLSQGTISKIIKRVTISLARHNKQFIRFPTNNEAPICRRNFFEFGGFPGVIGAVDCTHVLIDSPGGENAELFRNRKGSFSINVQGICTSDLTIINIVSRWYGSCHDNRIFENSKICTRLENSEAPGILLGDSGYACTPYLMTPFDNPTTAAQRRYNAAQIKSRNPIERCFGVLKQRFNCLRYLRLKLRTTLMVIVCCAMLHNIAKRFGDEMDFETTTVLGASARQRIVESHFT